MSQVSLHNSKLLICIIIFFLFLCRLGQGDIMSLDGRAPPLRVETLHMHGIHVRAVACGKEHTMAVTQEGKVRNNQQCILQFKPDSYIDVDN